MSANDTVPTPPEVRETELLPDRPLPLLVEPAAGPLRLDEWVDRAADYLETRVRERGGVLLRGFQLEGVAAFERFIGKLSDELLDYRYRSTPRSEVSGKIYTSTEYPADQTIPMHNEMSYTRSWPAKIWFYSVTPAAEGGETPISDSRRVLEKIDPEIRERFKRHGVTYIRTYGGGMDLSWQNVFQTDDRAEVEAFCRDAGIEIEWLGADGLRTRQTCQATIVHPATGEEVWFNQAHLFHVSSLPAPVREFLLEEFGEQGLPRNSYYGDGSTIGDAELDAVRAAYEQTQVAFPWRTGDVLMLDNQRVAHGRKPYSGERKVVVGMAEARTAPAA
jgi:alpha-ketoglutarate-dependent taurine dioxygenase